jgi:hypothetical protein
VSLKSEFFKRHEEAALAQQAAAERLHQSRCSFPLLSVVCPLVLFLCFPCLCCAFASMAM